MKVCSPISTCTRNVTCIIGSVQRQMSNYVVDVMQAPSTSCCFHSWSKLPKLPYNTIFASSSNSCSIVSGSQSFQRISLGSSISKNMTTCHSLVFKSIVNSRCYRKMRIDLPTGYQNMNLKLLVPKQTRASKSKCRIGPVSWQQCRVPAGFFIALLVCYSTSEPTNAEAPEGNAKKEKKVFTDYSVIGIPGDGRCLFRSVAHGACVRSGKNPPNEILQRELADELRARVADEFVKRRDETEWFIEGDFETYISKIREPREWGGEPELLMASHVLQMPITVYMHDQDAGGLIAIAEYGQEYGKDNPINVLYHGFGHYDSLHITGGAADSSTRLSWAARLRILQETAKGLMHIHECSPRKYVHGNIKSSKILLDDDLKPFISGFGLTRLVQGTSKSSIDHAYRKHNADITSFKSSSQSSTAAYTAPEARVIGGKHTQKCDVYSFGMVILEILTGRLPDGGPDSEGKAVDTLVRKVFREERPMSEIIDPALVHEVHSKKQVVATFHIALNCTEVDPELRPRMRAVSDNLDCIKLQ